MTVIDLDSFRLYMQLLPTGQIKKTGICTIQSELNYYYLIIN